MAATRARELEGARVLVDASTPRVAVITLNRPQVRNALDLPMLESLQQSLVRCEQDDAIRVVILTGAGSCFCSGDDLRAAQNGTGEDFGQTIDALQRLTRTMLASAKPIIAAFNGPAFGAGLELTLACDLRLATPSFVCGTPEVRLGLLSTNGASVLLPLLVGPSRARRMMLGGEQHDAQWCLEAGLVDEIAPIGELLPRACELASGLMTGSPGAVAATRHLLYRPLASALDDALRLEAQLCKAAFASQESKQGLEAHFSKHSPSWAAR